MGPRVRAAWPGARLAAPAFTVQCAPADNLAIHVGVVSAPAGSALVVQVDGVPERGYWGEVLATAAEARGLAGLVIDAGVRDVDALERHTFPVFSSCTALRVTHSRSRGMTASARVQADRHGPSMMTFWPASFTMAYLYR